MTTLKQLAKQVKIRSEYGAVKVPEGWPAGTHPYKVTLTYQRRRMTTRYFMGPAHTEEPTAKDVLQCLLLDSSAEEMDFHEFCQEYGYNEDSRKAEATYNACLRTAKSLRRLLGDEYETFLYAPDEA